jgi:glycosyltransferase involved in cell wall biosynthesis
VIPRQDTAYTRLALPIKLFDYLSHGLPVAATGPSETSKLLVTEQVGVQVRAEVGDLARTLVQLLSKPTQLRTMGDRARTLVATRHNWDARARAVLAALQLGS